MYIMSNRYAVILAAGKGTRMKSKLYKVLHPVAGKPMVDHVLTSVNDAGIDEVVTIVGHGAEAVQELLGDRTAYTTQTEQLGTGHAVQQAASELADKEGTTLVICGDTPLFTADTIARLLDVHEKAGFKATILTAPADDPTGYGRIVRDKEGQVVKIVEQKDANNAEKLITEINTGTYVFDNALLFDALNKVGNDNAQGEYYLPDVIEILKEAGEAVGAFQMDNLDESLGVNDRVALAQANKTMFKRINEYHMRNGVTIVDPDAVYIEAGVEIGADTVIQPNVYLKGDTVIGEDCHIYEGTTIRDSKIGDRVKVRASEIEESQVKDGVDIGPNAHLRPASVIDENAHIGNFVEIKKAHIGAGTKVGHLTYIGDATLGKNINVSCGVIFANYDGVNKHHSTIGDNSFIGSDVTIISPVNVEANAFLAAGSTITKDVPSKALGIARSRQENKDGFWDRLPIGKKD